MTEGLFSTKYAMGTSGPMSLNSDMPDDLSAHHECVCACEKDLEGELKS